MNIKVSRQKIYDSLIIIKTKYQSFNELCCYISYTPYTGLKLNVKPSSYVKKTCWMKNTLDVSECLNKKTVFDIAEAIGTEVEIWIKKNNFTYYRQPDYYSDYLYIH